MDITQNFESDSPRHYRSREKWFKYQVNLNSVFLSRTYKFECCMPSGSSSKARRLESANWTANCRLTYVPRSRAYFCKTSIKDLQWLLGRKVAFSSLELPSFETSFFATKTPLDVKASSFGSMKASKSMHQFPADVMPLQKSSGELKWCPPTTEKISISLRPGLELRSPIVERN